MSKSTPGLKYVGDGSAFDNIPARDLTGDEIDYLVGIAVLGGKYENPRELIKFLTGSELYTLDTAPVATESEE